MTKEDILARLALLTEEELNLILRIYREHRPLDRKTLEVFKIPEAVKKTTMRFSVDGELKNTIQNFPTHLTAVPEPSAELIDRCRAIYEKRCFCFDELGELLVQKCLEYATSYTTRPLLLYGAPGAGKTHRASVFAEMMGLPFESTNVPLAIHNTGLAGECGSYKNASVGILAKAMFIHQSCNLVLNIEEIDKDAKNDTRPSISEQFLKVLDQDATRFRDNRLGFDIDVSHIIYVFTANDKSRIPEPLLDRCDCIEVKLPTRTEVENILRASIIPSATRKLNSKHPISFCEDAVNCIMNSLWRGDETSLRQYQSLVGKCASNAYVRSVMEDIPVEIGKGEVEDMLVKLRVFRGESNARIGF